MPLFFPTVIRSRVPGLIENVRFLGTGRGVLALAITFTIASAALRLGLSENLLPDDAELIIEARQLRGGYSEQPPLYSWMLWTTFQLTGPGLVGLIVVRAALLMTLAGLTYRSAQLLVADRRLVAVLAFSSLLLPAYGWHIATYLTHSLLLGVAVMAVVYAVARIVRGGKAIDYVFLGGAVGVGALAKYNFPLVVASAIAAGLTVPAARRRLLHPRMLISFAVATLVVSPHVVWLAGTWEEVVHLLRDKSNYASSPPYWIGVAEGLWAAAYCLLGCVFLIVPLLIWLGRGAAKIEPREPALAWLGRFLLVLVAVHLALVFACGVTRFHDRWVQPFLLPFPLWYLGRYAPGAIREGRIRVLIWLTAALAAAILAAQIAQIVMVDRLPYRYDQRLDYARLARELETAGLAEATFISTDREIIGNLIPHMPRAAMYYPAGVEPFKLPAGRVVVLWDEVYGPLPPMKLMPGVAAEVGEFTIRPTRLRRFTLNSRNAAGKPVTVLAYALPPRR